jgi:hypothetical protein
LSLPAIHPPASCPTAAARAAQRAVTVARAATSPHFGAGAFAAWVLLLAFLLLPPAVHAQDARAAPTAGVVAEKAAAVPAELPGAGEPADAGYGRVQVTDPFVELHTGPGRGYPVFFVVQRGDRIALLSRHTDWYQVRTAAGKVGWVDRTQLASTLTEAGTAMSFRDVVLEDYLRRRAEFGGAWGHFSGSSVFKLWAAYNLNDTFALELAGGQVQGLYSGTSFWQLDVVAEPWSDRRLSPFFGIGVGKIDNVPNASLVSDISNNAKLANAMIGARYHLTDRLIARIDWTEYTGFISSARTDQYHALTAGLAFFF